MTDLNEQLTKYLTDAHSIEEQALVQLRRAPDISGDAQIAIAFEQHLAETDGHERTVRQLLEGRRESPSRAKDAIMAAGGVGFVWFARLEPDTPGKLCAHAFSYEALELASYELLGRVAQRAAAPDVVEAAAAIREQEQVMISRLEDLFDRSVEASLQAVGDGDLSEQVAKYLGDAHAIEEQAIGLLERAPNSVEGDGVLAGIFAAHLEETYRHRDLIEKRLNALGRDPSTLKDAMMRMGALNWASFFRAHPDTPGKLTAFAFAFEHLEIGGYEQLRRVADRAGDDETTRVVADILAEERAAAATIRGAFDRAVELSLAAVGATNV